MKESLQMAMAIADMNSEDQRTFFGALEATGLFTAEEIESIQITVGYLRLQKNPKMAQVLKREMAEVMYQQFNA